MIVKMKKYTFLIFHKDYHPFLYALRELGVVHVVEKQRRTIDENSELFGFVQNGKRFATVIKALNNIKKEHKIKDIRPENKKEDGMALIEKAEQLYADREQALHRKSALNRELERTNPWGCFDLESLRKLERANLFVHFHTASESKFEKTWTDEYNAIKIKQQGSTVYFVTITKEPASPDINAEHIKPFENSVTDLETALAATDKEIRQIDESLKMMVKNDLNTLVYKEKETVNQINWEKTALSSEPTAGEKIMLLEGFVPEEKETELIRTLETQDAYYFAESPEKDDKSVPILLKNNKFTRLFEPIGALYDFPHYHELDLTPFFTPFFMLFFGVCLGDAGYGLFILIATLIARRKVKPALKPILSLASILGAVTVFCGAIGGTLFGIPLSDMEWTWLSSIKKFMLDSGQMFNMALILGGVQIIFGMIVKAFGIIRRYGWIYSLETWGWLILLLGGGGLYMASNKGMLSPDTVRYLTYAVLGVSGLFIYILNTPGRNPIVNVGAGLWNTFNMATGLMGDLLSYIRLFALGLCGGVMGFVFNELAMQLSGNTPVVSQIVMLIILLIGHALNIFMSSLGAFVHPLRLTFVEFYKNAGFEGGGKIYKPFRYIPQTEN